MTGRILAAVLLAVALTLPAGAAAADDDGHGVWPTYTGHVQNIGWQDTVQGGHTAGTTGRALRLEAVAFGDMRGIDARAHVQNIGWMPALSVTGGDLIGTTGRSLRLEAIQVHATAPGVHLFCQAHVQNIGWMPPVSDGETCGTTGRALRLEAVRIWAE